MPIKKNRRWRTGGWKQENKEDELKRNMQIYGDSSIYLGQFLFSFPQKQLITEVTHGTLSVQTW